MEIFPDSGSAMLWPFPANLRRAEGLARIRHPDDGSALKRRLHGVAMRLRRWLRDGCVAGCCFPLCVWGMEELRRGPKKWRDGEAQGNLANQIIHKTCGGLSTHGQGLARKGWVPPRRCQAGTSVGPSPCVKAFCKVGVGVGTRAGCRQLQRGVCLKTVRWAIRSLCR
ncbi:hypothetical protein VTI74DRAFT_1903 [Chaetomium olivicolor]